MLTSSVRRILKRVGARNFRKFERNINQNLKLSHSNFVPVFAQNQVKSKKKVLHSNFVPFFAQNQVISSPKPDAQLAKGPCLNFAHFSMQFCNPGDPKGGPWPNAPLNTPLVLTDHQGLGPWRSAAKVQHQQVRPRPKMLKIDRSEPKKVYVEARKEEQLKRWLKFCRGCPQAFQEEFFLQLAWIGKRV